MLIKDYFSYGLVKDHFDNFIAENSEALKDSSFRDDLHHHAFNSNYFIIGRHKAKLWLGDEAFDVIKIIKDYEESVFGEVTTDLSEPESVVNMYAYIVGEEIVTEWLESNPLKEEVEE